MELSKPFLFRLQRRHLIAAFFGMLFALAIYKTMTLDLRFILAISGGILIMSIGMAAIRRVDEFLIYSMVFNIPFAAFGKWLGVRYVLVVGRGISVGLAEMLIVFAYVYWFTQIFITRKKPIPKLRVVDLFIAVLFFAQFLSLVGAPNKLLVFYDIVYNLKYVLMYFFLSHHILRHHLKWIVIFLLFGLLVESPLALYERISGNVGIGRTKGVQEYGRGYQYEVPGIEQIRAEGTTRDSHTLGLYYAMVLPLPLVLLLSEEIRPKTKIAVFGILLVGAGGLIVTFSRSGWLSCAIAFAFIIVISVFLWKQKKLLFMAIALFAAVSILYPRVYEYAFVRFFKAPGDILNVRYEMNSTAFGIWMQNFVFGYGAGNYMDALEDPNVHLMCAGKLPVHNAFLYIAAETGLIGVIGFFGIILNSIWNCFGLFKVKDFLIKALGLAICSGFIAYLLDGLTNPTFREAVPYDVLWIYIAIVFAIKSLADQPENRPQLPGVSKG